MALPHAKFVWRVKNRMDSLAYVTATQTWRGQGGVLGKQQTLTKRKNKINKILEFMLH